MAEERLQISIEAVDKVAAVLQATTSQVSQLAQQMAGSFTPLVDSLNFVNANLTQITGALGAFQAQEAAASTTAGQMGAAVAAATSGASGELGRMGSAANVATDAIKQAGPTAETSFNQVAQSTTATKEQMDTVIGLLTQLVTLEQRAGEQGKTSFTEINQALEIVKKGAGLVVSAFESVVGVLTSTVHVATDLVSAFAEDEASALRMAGALRQNIGASQEVIQAYLALSEQTAIAFGVQDESIKNSIRTLVTLGKTPGEVLPEALRAVVLWATATGDNVESVAHKYSLAMAELAEAAPGAEVSITRTGIAIKSTGDQIENAGKLAERVSSTFSEAAREMAGSASTQFARIGVQWGELKEKLGEAIFASPAVQEGIRALTEIIDNLRVAMEGVTATRVTEWVSDAVGMLAGLGGTVAAVAVQVEGFVAKLLSIPAAIGLITTASGAKERIAEINTEIEKLKMPGATPTGLAGQGDPRFFPDIVENQLKSLQAEKERLEKFTPEWQVKELETQLNALIAKTRELMGDRSGGNPFEGIDEDSIFGRRNQEPIKIPVQPEFVGPIAPLSPETAQLLDLTESLDRKPVDDLAQAFTYLAGDPISSTVRQIEILRTTIAQNGFATDAQRDKLVGLVGRLGELRQAQEQVASGPKTIDTQLAIQLLSDTAGHSTASVGELDATLRRMSGDSLQAVRAQIDALRIQMTQTGDATGELASEMQTLLERERDLVSERSALVFLSDQADAMEQLTAQLRAGTITWEEYEEAVRHVSGAQAELQQLERDGMVGTAQWHQARMRAYDEEAQELHRLKEINERLASPLQNPFVQFFEDATDSTVGFKEAINALGPALQRAAVGLVAQQVVGGIFEGSGIGNLAGGALKGLKDIFTGGGGGTRGSESLGEGPPLFDDAGRLLIGAADSVQAGGDALASSSADMATNVSKSATNVESTSQTILLSLLTPIATTQTTITTAPLVGIATVATVVDAQGAAVINSLVTVALIPVAGTISLENAQFAIIGVSLLTGIVSEFSGVALSLQTEIITAGAAIHTAYTIVEKAYMAALGVQMTVPVAFVEADTMIAGIAAVPVMLVSTMNNTDIGAVGLILAGAISGGIEDAKVAAAGVFVANVANATFTGPVFGGGGGGGKGKGGGKGGKAFGGIFGHPVFTTNDDRLKPMRAFAEGAFITRGPIFSPISNSVAGEAGHEVILPVSRLPELMGALFKHEERVDVGTIHADSLTLPAVREIAVPALRVPDNGASTQGAFEALARGGGGGAAGGVSIGPIEVHVEVHAPTGLADPSMRKELAAMVGKELGKEIREAAQSQGVRFASGGVNEDARGLRFFQKRAKT